MQNVAVLRKQSVLGSESKPLQGSRFVTVWYPPPVHTQPPVRKLPSSLEEQSTPFIVIDVSKATCDVAVHGSIDRWPFPHEAGLARL